jgi:drug/metabolite transporter (DMT)-like permease
MSRRALLAGFLLLVVFNSAAQLALKSASTGALPLQFGVAWLSRLLHQRALYGAVLGFVSGFLVWMALLRHAPIGPAFAASNLDIVTVLVASHWLLAERVGGWQIVGAGFIVAGVGCLAVASSSSGREPPG